MQRLSVGKAMLALLVLLQMVAPVASQPFVTPQAGSPRLSPLGEQRMTPPHLSPLGEQERAVLLEGQVLRPGIFPFQTGMRVKNLLLRGGGLRSEAGMVHGQILRVTTTGDMQVLFFNPTAALRGQRRDDLQLLDGDRVVIYKLTEAVPEAPVAEPPPAVELSAIERLMAGRIPEREAPLRQFGYDLFAPVQLVPEMPRPEDGDAERQDEVSSRLPRTALSPGPRRAPGTWFETPGEGQPSPFDRQRFTQPIGDVRFNPPTTDVPVGPDYIIGSGDTLNIVLWGGVEDTYEVDVNRNGAIVLPRLGVVQVAGLTLERLEQLLRQRFAQYYPDFQMAVTLGRLRTIRVYVVGEVQQPGAYTMSSLSTIITALFSSGGPTKNGSLRRIQLQRQGQSVHTLDLYDFLLRGHKGQDQALQSGDTIFVPVIGAVAGVAGNVRRPAIYEIEPTVTLQHLLELAGGVTPLGYLQRVQVERFVANTSKIIVDLDLSAPPATTASLWQTRLQDGDVVQIFPIDTQLENVVRLEGHVVHPGRYELKPGMRLRDLLPSYDVLLAEPYLEHAEIVRQREPARHPYVVPFDLGALLAGDATQNLLLQPLDTVRIFAHSGFIDPYLVRISGLVHRPGVYPLTAGMRVRDLVYRAGNVHKFAHLENAELTRRQIDVTDSVATRVEINLRRALAGDLEHNILLQDFDHLLVRQVPGIDLQRQVPGVDLQRQVPGIDLQRPAPGVDLQRPVEPPVFVPLREEDEAEIAILRRAGIVEERTVELRGEVRFPGVYPVLKGERLSSVLQRAGGYTDQAYLRGAVFTRESVRLTQQQRLQELIQQEEQALIAQGASGAQTALSSEEIAGEQAAVSLQRTLLERLRSIRPEGRMVIRLQPLETFTGSDHDIELESGDFLTIPPASNYVAVEGHVYNRTALIYEPGRDIGYYLDKVGGIKPKANQKEIFLVQADGTVVSRTQDQYASMLANGQTVLLGDFFDIQPQPGDTIVVPRKVTTPANLRATRDIIQIIFQSVSTLGVVLALL